MKDLLKNMFPLDGKSLWPENPFALPKMKHSLKNTFPLYRKTASFGKISKYGFH